MCILTSDYSLEAFPIEEKNISIRHKMRTGIRKMWITILDLSSVQISAMNIVFTFDRRLISNSNHRGKNMFSN